jgi:hypothetical protein
MPWHDPTILYGGVCRATRWRGLTGMAYNPYNSLIINYIIRLQSNFLSYYKYIP